MPTTDMETDQLHVPGEMWTFFVQVLFHQYAQAVSGILQAVHDVQLNTTVGRLITFPLCAMTDDALQTIIWLRATIRQVCVHVVNVWCVTHQLTNSLTRYSTH